MEILEGRFVKVPEPNQNDLENTTREQLDKVFSNMLGYKYNIYLSEFNNEYVILGGTTEEAEKELQESIYKSLIEMGEDEEYARKVAEGEEDYGACMYFSQYCFELIEK